jgi:hypothetical protein
MNISYMFLLANRTNLPTDGQTDGVQLRQHDKDIVSCSMYSSVRDRK